MTGKQWNNRSNRRDHDAGGDKYFAILAILLSETEADEFTECILTESDCLMSMVSFVEASIIAELNGRDGSIRQLDARLRKVGITIEPVREDQALVSCEPGLFRLRQSTPCGSEFRKLFFLRVGKEQEGVVAIQGRPPED